MRAGIETLASGEYAQSWESKPGAGPVAAVSRSSVEPLPVTGLTAYSSSGSRCEAEVQRSDFTYQDKRQLCNSSLVPLSQKLLG